MSSAAPQRMSVPRLKLESIGLSPQQSRAASSHYIRPIGMVPAPVPALNPVASTAAQLARTSIASSHCTATTPSSYAVKHASSSLAAPAAQPSQQPAPAVPAFSVGRTEPYPQTRISSSSTTSTTGMYAAPGSTFASSSTTTITTTNSSALHHSPAIPVASSSSSFVSSSTSGVPAPHASLNHVQARPSTSSTLGASPSTAGERRSSVGPALAENLHESRELLAATRAQLHALGPRCAIDLGSTFATRAAGKDLMDLPAAVHVLRSNRLRLHEPQYSVLCAPYLDGGRVRMGALIRDLLGSLNDRRKQLVTSMFDKLDINHDGLLAASDVRRAMRIAHHPLVVSGQATLDHVHTGFLSRAMDVKGEPVNAEQFEFYHAAISSAFRRDEDFAAWMVRFWRP